VKVERETDKEREREKDRGTGTGKKLKSALKVDRDTEEETEREKEQSLVVDSSVGTTERKTRGRMTRTREIETDRETDNVMERETETVTTPLVTKEKVTEKGTGTMGKGKKGKEGREIETDREREKETERRHSYELSLSIEEIAATYFQEIQSQPSEFVALLPVKHRLEPALSPAMSLSLSFAHSSLSLSLSGTHAHSQLQGLGVTASNHQIMLKGPLFTALFPPSLIHFLHHDRFDISMRLVQHVKTELWPILTHNQGSTHVTGGHKGKSSTNASSSSSSVAVVHPWLSEYDGHWLDPVMEKAMRPNVYDLLDQFPKRLQSANIGINQVDMMRYLFDILLESHILYPEEKVVFASLISFIRQRKISSTLFFGPYYLLRFVAVLTMAIQPTTNPGNNKSMFALISFILSFLIVSLAVSLCYIDFVTVGRVKGAFSEIEKMLDATLKHLEEFAPKLFF
jgi:hypothetical protein